MTKIRRRIDFAHINDAALPLLPAICARLLSDGHRVGTEWVAKNPTRLDRQPGSFSINLKSGQWADFATDDKGGDPISLVAYLAKTTLAQAGDALGAAVACFAAWFDDRGNAEPYEVTEAVERVTDFIELHGATRFERLPRVSDGPPECPVRDHAGYWRGDGPDKERLIFPSVWKAEVLKGLDLNAAARALHDKGMLHAKIKYQLSVKLGGASPRFYVVRLAGLTAAEEDCRADAEPLLI
jgi:hypothetical protein